MWHIAEINIASARAPLDDPAMASFVAQLDAVNNLADESPGFVWRLKGPEGGASSYIRIEQDDRLLVNMSVWTSIDALHAFVYRAMHGAVYASRGAWFEPLGRLPVALWWVRGGVIPTIDEGFERLESLTQSGPTPHAFTFKRRFASPELP